MANPWDEFQRPADAAPASPWDEFQRAPGSAKPGVVRDVISQLGQGLNRGIDATLNLPGTALNLGAQAVNYGAEKLGYEPPLPDEPFEPIPFASRVNSGEEPATAGGRVAGSVGEAVGGTLLPSFGLISAGARMAPQAVSGGGVLTKVGNAVRNAILPVARTAAQAPRSTLYNDLVSVTGAGLGVGLAREGDLGPAGELVAGLAGGVVAPNVVNATARTGGAFREGIRHTNRMVQRATNPRQAALDDVADAMIEAKVTPERVRHELVPEPSANFQARNIGEAEISDMIARSHAGETARDIAREYGVAERTVGGYLAKYSTMTPLPRNIIDVAKDVRGEGGATPLSNAGRTAMAIGGDADAAKRLTDRQYAQPGRVADTIQQTRIDGRSYDDEVERLAGIAKTEEDQAYGLARQNKQPIDLTPAIGTMRGRAGTHEGEIAEQMNKAADLFFASELRQTPQSPMAALRLTEADEAVQAAIARGGPPERIARLERRLTAMREQDIESRPFRQVDVGRPIDDIGAFIDKRRELGQMIARSYHDGKATPLTAELTAFRTRINQAARMNNKDLEAADLRFSENRTSERLLADGASLGKTLNQRSRQAIRDFRKMTPTQQEIFRVGFERQMADDALRVTRGNAAARQFNNDGFEAIVEELYPKGAGKAVHRRGQTILRNLRNEAISTDTINDVMRGSRTAPVANSIAEQQDLARAAANGLTGRVWKAADDLSNYLAKQIGKKAAAERLRILTTTEPDELFPLLVQLGRSAKTAAERQKWVTLIREFRRARLSPAQIGETAHMVLRGDHEEN